MKKPRPLSAGFHHHPTCGAAMAALHCQQNSTNSEKPNSVLSFFISLPSESGLPHPFKADGPSMPRHNHKAGRGLKTSRQILLAEAENSLRFAREAVGADD